MSWDDAPKLINARRGFSVIYGGKSLLSNIDPIGQAEQAADVISIKDRTLYFCPSPLLGYGLEKLLVRITEGAPNSALLCIEVDKNLFRLSQENISAEIKNNVRLRLTALTDAAALSAFVRQTWGERHFRRIEPVRFGGGWRLFQELYNSLEETLRSEIALDWSNALTLTKLGRLYIRNALRNLALIPRYPSISKLSFGDVPVLVLGAGPSLDSLLDGLTRRFGQKLQNSQRPFKIVCADTCLKALKERNIKPDFTVILESQHWNLRDFIGLGDWNINCAFDLSALPVSAKLPGFLPYLFFTPWTNLRLFDRLEKAGLLPQTIPPLGSVGLSAAAIALRITKGPVLTAGMDFSFSLDSYHARSTPGHLDKLRKHNRFRHLFNAAVFDSYSYETFSKSGIPVKSSPSMRNYRNLFEQEFSAETRLFDISSGGLPLGIKTLSEEEFFCKLEKPAPIQTDSKKNAADSLQNTSTEKLIDFIQAEINRLTSLRNILSGAEHSPEKLEVLIDECDYLWAHFPDYAGTGGRRPQAGELSAGTAGAISFLKRLRTEIDPALKIHGMILSDLNSKSSKKR